MRIYLGILLMLLALPAQAVTLNPTGMDTSTGLFNIAHPGDTFIFPGHIAYSGATPAVAAGAGAGTSPTISIAGTDNINQVTLTTGTLPTGANAVIFTITYAVAYPNGSAGICYAANPSAAALSGSGNPFPPIGTATTLTFKSGITGLVAATQYLWTCNGAGW